MGKTATPEMESRYGIEEPYTLQVSLRGLTPLLFNRFADLEGYANERVSPKKKPRSREARDYEAMVWRTDDGELGIPCQNVVGAIVAAGKYFRSPISSNGGATSTLREALVPAAEIASFGVSEWDCIDFRLARNGDQKRSPKPTWRPRLEPGWRLTTQISVVVPELYGPAKLLEILTRAGTVRGVGDGRTIGFGRFAPDGLEVEEGLPW